MKKLLKAALSAFRLRAETCGNFRKSGDNIMITIRKYEDKDKENMRRVCLGTSSFDIENKKTAKFITLMYCDYYTEAEPDSCFVAADENDNAVGYLICGKNFKSYYKTFKGLYMPEIKKLGLKYVMMAKGEIAVHKMFSKKYPAHLHIDLLDVCRHQGVGSRLMKELKAYLSENGIHSLMLSCGYDNKNAIRFYERNGFKKVANVFGSYVMACEF